MTYDPPSAARIPDTIVSPSGDLASVVSNASEGDFIYLKPGTHTIDTGLEINVSDVTIEGAGIGATTIFVDASANIFPIRIGNTATVSNIILQGFTLDGNYSNHSGPYNAFYHGIWGQSVSECIVRYVEVKNTYPYSGNDDTSGVSVGTGNTSTGGGDGILFDENASNVWIDNCWVHDTQWRGIDFWGTTCWVTRCRSIDNIDRGISGNEWVSRGNNASDRMLVYGNSVTGGTHLAAGIGIRDGSSNAVIKDNYVRSWTDGSLNRRGIVLNDHNHGIIEGNIVDAANFDLYGITVNDACNGIIVSDNYVFASTGSPEGGIFVLDTCQDVTVTGNVIDQDNFATPGSGFAFGMGIAIKNNCDGVTVTGNIVRSPNKSSGREGIAVNPVRGSSDSCSNVAVVGNYAKPGGQNGITIRGQAEGVIVKGNIVEDSPASGIAVENTGGGELQINSNLCRDNDAAGIFMGSFGQDITVSNITINNNVCVSNGAFGIRVEDDMSWWTCSGNYIFNNSDDGLFIQGQNGIVSNNVVRGTSHPASIDEDSNASNVHYRGNVLDPANGTLWSLADVDHTFEGNNPSPTPSDAFAGDVVNDRMLVPPTLSLGGNDGELSVTDRGPLVRYHILVDAGGSNSAVQGIGGPTEEGQIIVIEHTGGENVVLNDDDGSASAGQALKNQSGGNVTLDANEEMISYIYSGGAWREMWQNTQA